MFCRDKMEQYMPELYHKLGVGVVSWSPHSLSNDDGIQLISRRAISHEDKSFRSAKQLQLNTLAIRLGCDSVQLSIGSSPRLGLAFFVLLPPPVLTGSVSLTMLLQLPSPDHKINHPLSTLP